MANFGTHLAVGSVASGLAATAGMASNLIPNDQLLTLTLAGIVGSVLPDVDLEKATPSRMLFGGLGVIFAFVALFNFERQYSIVELWLVWMAVYLGIRHGVYYGFHKRTTHRGIFHSLLAGAVFAGITAIIFHRVFNETALMSWAAGFFVFYGFVVHLLLDEFSSVDFEGKKIKKSLGSALKLFDYNSVRSSFAMAAILAIVLSAAPPANDFIELVRSREVWTELRMRMWPQGEWFEMRMAEAKADSRLQQRAAVPQESGASGQTGGSEGELRVEETSSLPGSR